MPHPLPKFLIVTPSYHRAVFLDQTIRSVVSQSGDFEIDYIVQDGGSGDDVISILRRWEEEITSGRFVPSCAKLSFRWFSEKDNGMYDAINRGFARGDGDIMAWINTDDMYHPYAFQTISQILTEQSDIHWLTGIPNSYNEHGSRCGMDLFPSSYSREFIRRGYYDVKFLSSGFNWIQQESTFWRRSLWDKAGGALDISKKYVADFLLWQKFSEHSDLVKVYSFLGGYRCHDDQITADPERYRRELAQVAPPPGGLGLFNSICSCMPPAKRMMYNRFMLRLLGVEWDWMTGRTVRWSFADRKWVVQVEGII